MNTRELTPDELEKTEVLNQSGITYALLFLTDNGLKKSILDATVPIAQLLKSKHIHDYDSQSFGTEHKVMLPCIILSKSLREETTASLYRANGRGDTRFWPGRFHLFASPEQVFALFVENSNIVVLNLSDGQPLNATDGSDFSEILDRINYDSSEFIGVADFGEETQVIDPVSSELDEPSRFEVSSYGWDSDVEGLVKRLNRGDIKLPRFQRGFVWSPVEQSRFIESLILGLPVPNIFLALDRITKNLNIVDGQQRLKTLQRYLGGKFALSNSKKIHEDLRGCYYNRNVAKGAKSKVLEDADERTLSDSILHSIVIKPDPSSDSPEYGQEYNNAVVQIFRRLNTSGKALQPQEVRSCIFYGPLDELLHDLNKNESWRSLFGPEHSRYKDVETILRFLALYENVENYKAPMPSFLDKYMEDNRNMEADKILELHQLFERITSLLLNACGESLFRTGGTLLLSKFDAVTVGFAKAIASGSVFENKEINSKIELLLDDQDYVDSTAEFINDTGNVIKRVNAAIRIFKG
ncbi:DUF262 domain-containing protein [Neptunomonas antarctica]|uniref:Uncharacterized conserved protein, contains ParB-like and HNH nuclease domains n=1 Tax=Neptunomonas antarctica TaxID=619304 RepID=A0A1N7IVZ5_9GAMM|nr:DUF262 domain-containing protein [Neptunomonas antarctica]SIS41240.1 Uncharacterized conserved protein, contains ParB-like and HNH nuclease domains [Neptunomonas antarctica]